MEILTGTEIYDYHRKMYGEDFTYADFAPMFKALSHLSRRMGHLLSTQVRNM